MFLLTQAVTSAENAEVARKVLYGCSLAIVLLLPLFAALALRMTQKSLVFGVRLPQEHVNDPAVRRIKRGFIVKMVLVSVLLALPLLPSLRYSSGVFAGVQTWIYLVYILLYLAVYISSWRQVRALKAARHWETPWLATASIRTGTGENRPRLAWGWFMAGTGVFLLLIILAALRYETLPDRIPTHFDFRMEPDRWADKSWGQLLILPLTGYACGPLLGLGMHAIIRRQKLQVSYSDPARSHAQHRRYRHLIGQIMGAFGLLMMLFFACLYVPLLGFGSETTRKVLFGIGLVAILLAAVVGLPVAFMKMGQAGSKLKVAVLPEDTEAAYAGLSMSRRTLTLLKQRNDDRFWKFGLFYYNPDDPSLFVEDRFGANVGFNYGRRAARVVTVLLVLLLIGSLAVMHGVLAASL